jgi:hypothetical protein
MDLNNLGAVYWNQGRDSKAGAVSANGVAPSAAGN